MLPHHGVGIQMEGEESRLWMISVRLRAPLELALERRREQKDAGLAVDR